MGTLYIVATPIGNLEDITLRALRVLKEVDIILCEDTRTTKKLLQKYEIDTPTMSYHSHSKLAKVEKIFELLEDGENLALVSDAGTPTISDPGVLLVRQIKEKFGPSAVADTAQAGDEARVVPIPGPSALIAALSASGVSSSEFVFLGFLPHKKGRETLFKEIAATKRAVVFYESPHRVLKTLASLNTHTPNRSVVLARELTKIHEEFLAGTAAELISMLKGDPQKQKGEFVVVVKEK